MKVVEAAKLAEERMKKLKEIEAEEAERARGEAEQKVLSGDIDWLQYLRPMDTTDIEECAKMDKYNHGVFQHNNAMLPKVNELQKKLGREPMRVDAPPKYVPIARRKYEEMLWESSFRVMGAIFYLAERDIFPLRDYAQTEMDSLPKKADEIAREEEIARRIEDAGDEGIDIAPAAGNGHAENCTCENRWDGESERCIGEGVRVRWRTLKDHHFLRPRIVPEKY